MISETVLPKYSKCQEKVVLRIWKCLSVSAFPVASIWYVENTGGCYLIGLIISKILLFLKRVAGSISGNIMCALYLIFCFVCVHSSRMGRTGVGLQYPRTNFPAGEMER